MKTIAILCLVLFAGACQGNAPVCIEGDDGECLEPISFPQGDLFDDGLIDGQVFQNPDAPPAPIVAAPQE